MIASTATIWASHDRIRSAPYIALDVRALRRFSFSLGVRDEIYGSFNHELSPTFAAGYWVAPALKIRASVSRAFRLPSYTDLYYHDPANIGLTYPSSRERLELRGRRSTGMRAAVGAQLSRSFKDASGTASITFAAAPTEIWRATNFQRLQFTGVEAESLFDPRPITRSNSNTPDCTEPRTQLVYRNQSTSSITRSIPA